MKTYEVKTFRKRGECETIRGLTSTQMVALAETFSHYGVSYKRFTYDGDHLESVDWVEAPDLLAALKPFAEKCPDDPRLLGKWDHPVTITVRLKDLRQARAALAGVQSEV